MVKSDIVTTIITLALSRANNIISTMLNWMCFLKKMYHHSKPSIEHSDKSIVHKLHKALYLKQARKVCFDRITSTLLQFGFLSSKWSLFICTSQEQYSCIVYILVYVVDVIIPDSTCNFIQQVVTKLNSVFFLKELGHLEFLLSIEVKPQDNGSLRGLLFKLIRLRKKCTSFMHVQTEIDLFHMREKMIRKHLQVINNL